MKKLILSGAVLLGTLSLQAQDHPLWMRYCALSPDGKTIAFTYQGDIFTVPVQGGKASQLTSNAAYDSYPVWSPDSKHIAFASDRMGSLDVFVVAAEGGIPKRLTTPSGKEIPIAFQNDSTILFSASLQPSVTDLQFPSGIFTQVYKVGIQGGRPQMFSSLTMENISFHPFDTTQWLYQDKKGYEDPWRKHEKASITRDIWLCHDKGERSFEKLTDYAGEDRNPVWAPDGKSYYYLSEEKGSFNVFQRTPGKNDARQLTFHTQNPVRFLSVSKNGTLCYGLDGEIYTLVPGNNPQKVNIQIVADNNNRDLIKQIRNSGATDIALSPNHKEVAFILRGDVYVTSVEYETTRRITNTPEQERNIQFSPDGRHLAYSSERNGIWQIYQASLCNKEDKLFTYAEEIKEERLINSNITSFEPQYSPDGKEIAFLEDRTCIRVLNLKSRQVRTVMDGKYQYSYSDGDQWFQWSPDSKWILSDYIGIGGWNNKDVVLLNADGKGEMHNLTESGYTDGSASWVLGGKAMIWFSDRAGYRSHGSWGAETDAYIMFFDVEAYERFRMNKEDLALLEEAEKEKKKDEEDTKKKKEKESKKSSEADKEDKQEEVKPLVFDLENFKDRVIRLTVNSSFMGDGYLSPKGDKFYYQAAFEGDFDLWVHDLKEGSTKILAKGLGGGRMIPDKKGENIYMCTGGKLKKVDLEKGSTKDITFNAFFDYQPFKEREYIFDHVWQQVKDKFYVTDLQGTDWTGYKEVYRKFLPHINNNYDFAEMLSEMLGELNASHTGARYSNSGAALATASLGVFLDDTYLGDGLKIAEIIAKSPLAAIKTEATAGCIIEKIDGQSIRKGEDYYPLLEGKVGRKMVLTIYNPKNGKRFTETVKGISRSDENELLYKRWVERNRKMTETWSNGRVGYVHIKGMDSPSFRTLYSELLGRYRNVDAVVIDTRHNGGGWLHDDVVTLLSGKEYQQFVPRGQYIGSDPFNKWLKPSCMLICEDNYSNACGTPWVYRELGIGKLVGAPIPGTMTAVWWEQQIDPSLVFGIPQVGCRDMRGQYSENHQVEPDIAVYNSPEDQLKGNDVQLKTAVELMLKTVEENKNKQASR